MTDTHAAGYVTAYGNGVPMPTSSNANWTAGQTVSNFVLVALHNGKVSLYNGSGNTVNFIADLVGFYHQFGMASLFLPASPTRLADTRTGAGTGHIAKLGPGQSIKLQIAGANQVPPTGIVAAQINMTVTNADGGGYLTAYPDGVALPTTSSLNYSQGQTVANMAITPVGANGAIQVYNGGWAPIDVMVDLYGTYYQYPIS